MLLHRHYEQSEPSAIAAGASAVPGAITDKSTKKEFKAFAKANDIDLGDAKTNGEIFAAITAAQAAAATEPVETPEVTTSDEDADATSE